MEVLYEDGIPVIESKYLPIVLKVYASDIITKKRYTVRVIEEDLVIAGGIMFVSNKAFKKLKENG